MSKKFLTFEETKELFDQMRSDSSPAPRRARARDRVVESNIRLVWKIARSYANRGCDVDDLVQEGSMGLMRAIEKFDPGRGVKFSTYATWWVRQAIGRHLANNSSQLRVPAHISGLQSRVRALIEDYKKVFDCEPSYQEIADQLLLTVDHVKMIMESRGIEHRMSPLDSISGEVHSNSNSEDSDDVRVAPSPTSVGTPFDHMASSELRKLVRGVLGQLSPREERVIRLRFGITEDLNNDIDFPITEEEIRELEARARAASSTLEAN